jgi:ShK domain-like
VVAASREFGVAQQVKGEQAAATLAWIEATIVYMQQSAPVTADDDVEPTKKSCQNRHEFCAFWAVIGECDSNPTYMQNHCGPSCRTCHEKMVVMDSGDGSEHEEEEDEL